MTQIAECLRIIQIMSNIKGSIKDKVEILNLIINVRHVRKLQLHYVKEMLSNYIYIYVYIHIYIYIRIL